MSNFKTRPQNRDYPARIVEKHLSEIKFSDREMSLAQKNKTAPKKILPFVSQYPGLNMSIKVDHRKRSR